MTGRMPRRRRVAILAVLVASVSLAGCSGADAGAVGPDDLAAALVAVTATGSVAEPGAAAAEATSLAGGFVIAPEGFVVTTADAVVGATDVTVQTGDGDDAMAATVVGASECLDLAVLRVDGDDDRPFLAWRRGAVREGVALRAGVLPSGDEADAAAGATPTAGDGADAAAGPTPAAGEGTATSVEEPFTGSWVSASSGVRHDVALTPDAAGAPLVDEDGRVAAIAHVGDVDADGGSGAVVAVVARDAVERIIAGDDAGSLGISARAWADAEGAVSGVWVRAVRPDGPAAASGVQPGDVVTMLDDRPVGADGTLSAYCAVLARAEGDPVAIEVYRPATDEVLAGTTGGSLAVVSTGEVRRSGGFTTVVDASGLVRVDVPAEWGSVDGSGFTDGSGNVWYSVAAAPNVERFRAGRTAPGVQVAATGGGATAGDLLGLLSAPFTQDCEPLDTAQPFDDGTYVGGFSRFTCDGTVALVLSVRNARGNNVTVIAQLASVTDQEQTLSRILSTFFVGR